MNIFLNILRYLTLPLALLYGLIIKLRNYLYDKNILRSIQLSLPSIAIGNLTMGGSGKTPHIEYLIKLLNEKYKIATLSRGYKRNSRGFLLASENDDARTIGDEPMQFKTKFSNVYVSVCEERLLAIPNLISKKPDTEIILMDDAFQHRSIKPGLNILLTEYNKPYYKDYIVPLGNLRESSSGACRANIIIVSKCPDNITTKDKDNLIQKLKPLAHQQVFCSAMKYGEAYNYFSKQKIELTNKDVVLVAGIANPHYLCQYLETKTNFVHLLKFKDHFYFAQHNIEEIIQAYSNLNSSNKIILSTEKDATRLVLHKEVFEKHNIDFCVLPIEVEILLNEKQRFNDLILQYIEESSYEMQAEEIDLKNISVEYTVVE